MELKTAFTIIMGMLMTATIIIAIVAIMGGLTEVMVKECEPAQYRARSDYDGLDCGLDGNGNPLYCKLDKRISLLPDSSKQDICFDEDKSLCCPTATHKEQEEYKAEEDYSGVVCTNGETVLRCKEGSICADREKNICKPQTIRIMGETCCRLVEV
ncbi:MAG: hypothetical protein JW700_02265 [Candidatus Aenigmarchaeota archaeon]|nr:hypothetical protein [Candidatus Aenigmarchaeota archaeon]